jgi:hypothetical protein
MIRLRAGDYLLPSNSGLSVWRIHSYEEYGDAVWVLPDGTEKTIKGTFWAASRCKVSTEALATKDDDWILDHENYEMMSSTLPSRKAAIEEALSYGP